MNIEQAIDILKNSIADYVIGEYCEKCADNKICEDRNEDCYYQQAIDMVLTAYEKEKEKNKNAIDFINERKKTVNKDMVEGTRLQVGTFMWQVDELLEILKGVEEE